MCKVLQWWLMKSDICSAGIQNSAEDIHTEQANIRLNRIESMRETQEEGIFHLLCIIGHSSDFISNFVKLELSVTHSKHAIRYKDSSWDRWSRAMCVLRKYKLNCMWGINHTNDIIRWHKPQQKSSKMEKLILPSSTTSTSKHFQEAGHWLKSGYLRDHVAKMHHLTHFLEYDTNNPALDLVDVLCLTDSKAFIKKNAIPFRLPSSHCMHS